MESPKKVVSVRLGSADLAKVKEISRRLRIRESDVYRFALKSALARLAPIYDPSLRGRDMVPVFVDLCLELAGHFHLDAARLESLMGGALGEGEAGLEAEDIRLISMLATSEQYAGIRFREISRRPVETARLSAVIREYLEEKYVGAPVLAPAAVDE
jgi:hypothetical protein